MTDAVAELKAWLAEINDLNHAAALLEWDQQTYMPPGGAPARSEQTATLRKLAHEKLVSDETAQRIERARSETRGADPDGDPARLVKVAAEDHERARRIPTTLIAEMSRATSLAQPAWMSARREKNFALFKPHLERVLDLKRQVSACYGQPDSVYDPLLDDYEPGMKAAQVRAVFDELKRGLIPLVKAIAQKPETDDGVLRRDFDEQTQWQFGEMVIRRFGFDFERGRQDRAPHPFCTSFSTGDVRLTTRVAPRYLPTALMGTLHEAGHGLYEQGFAPALARTPLAAAASLGIHESQSRMWENLVGRSRPFWTHFYPQLQAAFPQALGDTPLEVFYRAINKVKPSLIRIEADEVTYNLHTLLRFEMEIDLLEGKLPAADAPAAWNAKVKDNLGLDVPDDGLGVLQDIHWSAGLIGYFPTYTLGNILSVQFFDQAVRDRPAILAELERGEFHSLLGWLREHIHQHGRKFTAGELVERATGSQLDAAPYLAYLNRKYSEIYGL